MNNYEFKSEGQSVYFRPNENCAWLLLCVAFDEAGGRLLTKALQKGETAFSILYQFQMQVLFQPSKRDLP